VPNVRDIIKTFDKLENTKDLPDAFEVIVDNHQVVERTLSKVSERLDASDQASWPEITAIASRWHGKIKSLHGIFKWIASQSKGGNAWAGSLNEYRVTLTKLGNGRRVEELMKDVLEESNALGAFDAFGKSPERQLSKFRDAIKNLSEVKASTADIEGPRHGNIQNVAGGGRG
jgi:hypothetical protein